MILKGKRLPIQMSLIRQFAIRNKLLYSGFVLPNVQIFFVQIISFATFGVSIDDFLRDTLVWAAAYIIGVVFGNLRRIASVGHFQTPFQQQCKY